LALAARLFYRVVRNNPPTIDDFKSLAALGRSVPPNVSLEVREAWQAVSVFVTREGAARQARANASRGRPLGDYIAELRIPPDAPVRTDDPRADGHLNLWAEPAVLLAAVTLPVERVDSYGHPADLST